MILIRMDRIILLWHSLFPLVTENVYFFEEVNHTEVGCNDDCFGCAFLPPIV